MNSFALLMATFLSISLFQEGVPQYESYKDRTPEEIVQVYHKTCQALLNLPELKKDPDFNPDAMVFLVSNMLQSAREKKANETTQTEKVLNHFTSGLDIQKLIEFYSQVCKSPVPEAFKKFELDKAVAIFEKIKSELPDHMEVAKKLPQMSLLLDRDGKPLSELYKGKHRRLWVDIDNIPDLLQKAFVAIEDKKFFSHKGIDENGLIRAFIKTFIAKSDRIQGGSSITQQLMKNKFTKSEITIERKIKEFILTKRVEDTLGSKDRMQGKKKILEHYLNLIYLGRNSWGIRTASQSYFGKELHQLNLSEMAFLAALPKGPNNYEPSIYKARALKRMRVVLNSMRKAGFITPQQQAEAKKVEPDFKVPQHHNKALYVADYLRRASNKVLGIPNVTEDHYVIQTTIHSKLQEITESALQKGLVAFEKKARLQKRPTKTPNIASYLKKKDTDGKLLPWDKVFGLRALKYKDIHAQVAVVLNLSSKGTTLGFEDGKTGKLVSSVKGLRYGDIIHVNKDKKGNYRRQITPRVQGAAVVMDVHSGEILALTGGYSFRKFPFNRATHGKTHPGSTLKPFTYMLALDEGLQPNTLIYDQPVTLPQKPGCREWSPKNYSNTLGSARSLRFGLEKSKNLMLTNLIRRIPAPLEENFQAVREILRDFEVYDKPGNCYPLLLGGQSTSLLRMVRAYAAIANGGKLLTPRFFKSVSGNIAGRLDSQLNYKQISSVDDTSLFQLRHLMQGVLARGTAVRAKKLSPFVAGKTGTSNRSRSAWFIGFSKDLVVGVYVAYDRKKGLGRLGTGGQAALPIAQDIFEQSKIYKALEPFPNNHPNIEIAEARYNYSSNSSARKLITLPEVFRKGLRKNIQPELQSQTLPEDSPLWDPPSYQDSDRNNPAYQQQLQEDPGYWGENSNSDNDFYREPKPRRQKEEKNPFPWLEREGQLDDDPFADDQSNDWWSAN